MPILANMTVKAVNGSTDVIYVAQKPAAGDNDPAIFRVDAVGTVAGNRPLFQISSKSTADKKARILTGKLSYPETYTDSTTGLVSIRTVPVFSFTWIASELCADATKAELAAQAANVLKHALIQSCMTTGYAPT